jgi:hypothetical protein
MGACSVSAKITRWAATLLFSVWLPAAAQTIPSPTFNNVTVNGTVTGAKIKSTGSSTARSLEARSADVGNVLDFGADKTQATNSTAAFTAALAAHTNVYVPPGRYSIASCITVPANSVLFADPGTATLISSAGNSPGCGAAIIKVAGVSHVRIRGLILDGNIGAGAQHTPGFTVNQVFGSADDVVFEDDTFQNTAGAAVAFTESAGSGITNSGVRNSTFVNIGNWWAAAYGNTGLASDAKQAIVMSGSVASANKGNFVTGNSFGTVGSDVISVQYQTDFMANNNRINGVGGWFTGVVCPCGVAGVYLLNNNNYAVLGNTITGVTGHGIDEAASSDNGLISGNTISTSGGAGISLGVSPPNAGMQVVGNHVRNSQQSTSDTTHLGAISISYGLFASGTLSNSVISGNVLIDDQGSPTQQYGLWSQTSSMTLTNVSQYGNTFAGNVVAPLGGAISTQSGIPVTTSQVVTASSGTVTQANNTSWVAFELFGSGGGGGPGLAANSTGSGGGGGGGGGRVKVGPVTWASLGVTSCTVAVGQPPASGTAGNSTTLTCGAQVWTAGGGGKGQTGANGANTGGGGGAGYQAAGNGSAGTGGANGGPGAGSGGSGAAAGGTAVGGSGGGGDTSGADASAGGNALWGATGGGAGGGCNANVAKAGAAGGTNESGAGGTAGNPGNSPLGASPGTGGGGSAGSTTTAAAGGAGGTPGGGGGGGGNGCNAGTAGVGGAGGGGRVNVVQG